MRCLFNFSFSILLVACSPGKVPRNEMDSGSKFVDTAETGDSGEGEPPRSLGSGSHALEHDGLTRDFILHVPADLPVGAPLVFVLHGYSDSAPSIQRYSGMDEVADREGFAVVYPQGTVDSFGYAYWEVGYAFHDATIDDVGYLDALRTLLLDDQGLDAGAVFATGMSNGGDMMYRLACEAAGDYRAVAPVAGCLMGWLAEDCSPSPEVPLLEIHGTRDRTTPWDGDMDGSDGYGPYYGTEESVARFVDAYGLDSEDTEHLPDLDPDDGSTVIAHRWSSATTDTQVWLYEIDGGGHAWPPSSGNQDIVASEEIWSFFDRYR